MTAQIKTASSPFAQDYLAAIRLRESKVGAWVHIDPRAGQRNKPLFGVKDVIDVRGMPTRAGSQTRADAMPASADATIVHRMRHAGWTPLGKTVTTEFAFVDPAPTRNPYALMHSPGGSSSGSAAAVAAGMVSLALGTQTAGSLCRPAAYCGIAAIKPSYGLLPTDGMVPLAPSFDTLGVMARDVWLAAQALAVMAARPNLANGEPPAHRKLAYLPENVCGRSSSDMRDFHRRTITALTHAGFSVEEADIGIDLATVIEHHRVVMLWEAYSAHGALLKSHANLLMPRFRDALLWAATLSEAQVNEARSWLAAAREQVWDRLGAFDAILLEPAPTPAPRGLMTTGDQSYQTPWTAFYGPLITVPGELNSEGLPLATMVGGRPGSDRTTIAIAKTIQSIIDRLPAVAPV